MVYIRVKPRVMAMAGDALRLGDVADLLADARLELHDMMVSLPQGAGIWQIDALQLIVQIQGKMPDEVINVLGDGTGWLHREVKRSRDIRNERRRSKTMRVTTVCLLFAIGCALAIGWLHSDMNMAEAQNTLNGAAAAEEARHPLLIALTYAIGVGVGVVLYKALFGKKTITPLTVKLREYREEVEKNAKQGGGNS